MVPAVAFNFIIVATNEHLNTVEEVSETGRLWPLLIFAIILIFVKISRIEIPGGGSAIDNNIRPAA